jgi:predicted ATPase
MIEKITIENYKSIQQLELELGRVTVLIGANGSGKSNILEAIAFCSAAANNKLDNEFLTSRGIRVTDNPQFMRSAFERQSVSKEIKISVSSDSNSFNCILEKKNDEIYSTWNDKGSLIKFEDAKELIHVNHRGKLSEPEMDRLFRSLFPSFVFEAVRNLNLGEFVIFSPEISSLRTFQEEGQIQPLGRNGEGLFKLLKVLSSSKNKKRLEEIKSKLNLIDWFSDFDVAKNLASQEKRIQIKDKYIDEKLEYFDQKSSNEGFLFLLFYLCLFVSSYTPNFFAIDNIDASLNPKLCSQLMIELTALAKKYKKQVIFTTHNPAVLDGLNLNDKNQKLYVVNRNKLGHTKINRFKKPEPINGKEPVKLSEAFLRGYLGGLPNNF